MRIQDFADMREFRRILSDWAAVTGLAAAAMETDGRPISETYNYTDFCAKYTKGSSEGSVRCEKCRKEGQGVYRCHAGLMEFSIDLVVDGEIVGYVIGGQALTKEPAEGEYRRLAQELGVDEEAYLAALQKVHRCTEEMVRAAAGLLGTALNHSLHTAYRKKQGPDVPDKLEQGLKKTIELVEAIKKETSTLQSIQARQKILALNASIEAARAGDKGAGFAVVASEVAKLSERSTALNRNIEEIVAQISDVAAAMQK